MKRLETDQQLLPDDLIIEILSRLPMPAISKFRCVSKSWINIIDSSSFAELHLRNYCNKPTSNNDSCVLMHNFDFRTKILKISMMLAGCHRLCREFSLDSDFESDTRIDIVGPVNGLICIYEIRNTERFTLCNPYLGETKALPRAPRTMRDGSLVFHRVGLGFDPVHKDIKVVQLLCYSDINNEGKHTRRMLVAVYSRNTNIWTILEDNVSINRWVGGAIAISDSDGSFCHWVALPDQDGGVSTYVVLSFDVCNGVFYTTQLPPCISDASEVRIKVFGKGGTLVLFSSTRVQPIAEGGDFWDMWVLSGLGKEGRWTWRSGIGPLLHLSKPVGLWKSRRLVLYYIEEKRFVIYDYQTHEITNMDIDVEDECNPKVVEFKGSLVSLRN
ncbi:hypothetical protein CASFOL_036715 [Castilleja foliolosa]|uniref:F-box domain-containing protein n=1 Tax=Castilleja foliolosa TaxID=1961234 RepID=A0ABD3BNY7_9LAMI